MELLILADYYEQNGFIKKAHRLRRRSSKLVYGYYVQYNYYLGKKYTYNTYGYDYTNREDWQYYCGYGYGYYKGNGWNYRWNP